MTRLTPPRAATGLLLAVALLPAAVVAQDDTAALDPITVKGEALGRSAPTYSTTEIDTGQIRDRGISNIEQMFREVPGMNVQDFQLGGVASATVIRGFGGGAHGGDLGLVVDGIPLNEANSHADGYVDTSVLVPLEIAHVDVYRGPVSALYGNFNRGGLVAIRTRRSGEYTEADLIGTTTNDGALDAQFAVGRPVGRNGQFNGAAQFYGTEGFRAQSRARRGVLAGRYATTLGERWDLAVSTRWFEGEADSAAYVPLAQFAVDPYGIDPRTLNDGSDKRFATLRVDAGTNVGRDLRLLTFAYTTQQDFTRWFTRGPQDPAAAWRQREESYDRSVFGLGTSLNGRQTIAGREVDFVLGIEGFDESTDEQFFDDLDNRVRTSPAQRDREATLESVSAFAEASIALAPRWQASVGLRYDRFTGDCRRLGPETGNDPCDTLDSIDNFSPKLGLKWQATDALALRASVAEGFALPTGFAKFAPGAQALDPNTLRQFELGLAARAGRFDLDLALYQIDSSQEIGQPAPGEFENFGATERQGLELSTGWQLLPTLGLRAIFGRTDSEITRNRNAERLGNRVSGVPDETLTLLAEWAPAAQPLSITAIYRHVGAYQLNAANSDAAPSYRVVDLIAQYRLPGDRERRLQLLIDNIFDEVYATTINSLGAAPGAPLTLRLGLKFDL